MSSADTITYISKVYRVCKLQGEREGSMHKIRRLLIQQQPMVVPGRAVPAHVAVLMMALKSVGTLPDTGMYRP